MDFAAAQSNQSHGGLILCLETKRDQQLQRAGPYERQQMADKWMGHSNDVDIGQMSVRSAESRAREGGQA